MFDVQILSLVFISVTLTVLYIVLSIKLIKEEREEKKQKAAAKKEEEKKELIERIKGDAYLMGILEPVLSRFGVQEEVASQ